MLIASKAKPDVLLPLVVEVMGELLKRHGEVVPLQVLLTLELVDPDVVETWRKGGLPYLERGVTTGLARVTRVLVADCTLRSLPLALLARRSASWAMVAAS